MKIVFFRMKKNSKDSGLRQSKRTDKKKISFERILFFSFIIVFFALVTVQTILVNPSTRTYLVEEDMFEGRPLNNEEYLYDQGEISLALSNGEVNDEIKVLVNGEEVSAFSNNVINLIVKDNDIIEIDGCSLVEAQEIEIVSKSDNIKDDIVGKKIILDNDVKQLTRIRMQ